MSNSSIWPIDRTLSGATTPAQSGPWSNANEGVLCIPQSSRITEASLSDCLMLYPRHSLEGVLLLFRDAVCVFYSPSRLGLDRLRTHWRPCFPKKILHFLIRQGQPKSGHMPISMIMFSQLTRPQSTRLLHVGCNCERLITTLLTPYNLLGSP